MNLGDIKAFVGDKPNQVAPDQQLKQQLREIGLRQASTFVGVGANGATAVVSSQTTVGLRVYNNSLNQTLSVNEKQPNLPAPESKNASLFDFEEVAKNVLRFVGGVINQVAKNGADDQSLLDLFDQARSGVLKGIKMAEKDLAGFMNEEIEQGIANSRGLIEEGIKTLQDRLLGNQREDTDVTLEKNSESVNYSKSESGEIVIRTRDGDEVSIRFEDSEQFEYNREQLIERAYTQPVEPDPAAPQALQQNPSVSDDDIQSADDAESQVAEAGSNQTQQPAQRQVTAQQEESYLYYERSSLSFSVTGELDEDELNAIADLVGEANDLAGTFFSGDIESAFQQALEIGYDEQELAGFALQLTRQEQVEVVKAYETVSRYDDDNQSAADPVSKVKPISEYLEKMLNVLDQSRQKLEDGNAYENLVNGIINEVQDVGTNDLLEAINRFHSFNKQLLNALPTTQNEQ